MDEFKKEVKEICRACIDVKSWFKETGKPIMKTSASISAAILYSDPMIDRPTINKESSTGVVCPPDSKELGRSTWTFLHTTAAYLPDKPSSEQKGHVLNLLNSVSSLYPCRHCAEHLQAYIEVNPVSVESKQSISAWLCKFHNEVNQMLGKEQFDCSKMNERWKNGPNDDSCS